MKKVLYLTNIEVPYRVRFFNELAKYCDLTVLYERCQSKNRDKAWTASEQRQYRSEYLNGINISNENSFSLKILKYVTDKYDVIVIGCYNSPVQAMAILFMKLFRIRYYLNADGEIYLEGNGLKNWLKRMLLRGAETYLVAGEKAAASISAVAKNAPVVPYYFSSLSKAELLLHKATSQNARRNNTILVVGQYFDYKGMDVALEAARMDPTIQYKFVGMGNRTELFRHEYNIDLLPNVTLIPFLRKEVLEQEYQRCAMLVLPSRKECWGLVVNEAASFGMPIISTWGSGAATEFLSEKYAQYLAKPGDAASLLEAIRLLQLGGETEEYSLFLQEKSLKYCIETNCQVHLRAFDIWEENE